MFRYFFVAALCLSSGYLWGLADGAYLVDSSAPLSSQVIR